MKKIDDKNALREYLRHLSTPQQAQYAADCGTTVGYLRKHLCKRTRPDLILMARLVANSNGRVTFEALRPDVDWDELRRLLVRSHSRRTKPG